VFDAFTHENRHKVFDATPRLLRALIPAIFPPMPKAKPLRINLEFDKALAVALKAKVPAPKTKDKKKPR
jgi:hypothetical protein